MPTKAPTALSCLSVLVSPADLKSARIEYEKKRVAVLRARDNLHAQLTAKAQADAHKKNPDGPPGVPDPVAYKAISKWADDEEHVIAISWDMVSFAWGYQHRFILPPPEPLAPVHAEKREASRKEFVEFTQECIDKRQLYMDENVPKSRLSVPVGKPTYDAILAQLMDRKNPEAATIEMRASTDIDKRVAAEEAKWPMWSPVVEDVPNPDSPGKTVTKITGWILKADAPK